MRRPLLINRLPGWTWRQHLGDVLHPANVRWPLHLIGRHTRCRGRACAHRAGGQ